MDINSFLHNEKYKEAQDIFEQMCVGKSDEEIRELELKFFKPGNVSKFYQKDSTKKYNKMQDMIVKVVFDDVYYRDLFFKYFNVLTYVENNVKELKLLYKFLDMLEKGEIVDE